METPQLDAALPVDAGLSSWLRAVFARVLGAATDPDSIRAVATTAAEFGDYQCNGALALAKALNRKPRDLAQAIAAAAERDMPASVVKIDVAGPGFLNLHLNTAWLARRVEALGADERCGVPQPGTGRTVVIDYSSPNVAKPMHVGHIRSTVIGNALDRLYRFLGYRVIADNHLGDWGTQFGILILGYRHFIDRQALLAEPVEELERVYVKSYEQTQASAEWLEKARQELVKLQAGEAENLRLWKEFVQLSLGEFEHLYRRLDVRFDLVRGESHYHQRLPDVTARLRAAGVARESEGALVAFLEEEKLSPCIVQKSDGAFNYAATDIATVLERVAEFQPERIVYVTDERQQLHFRQVFAICRRLGVTLRLDHVWFGLMRLPEGTFSTRQGNVIKLERLLDEAETRALELVRAASPEMAPEMQKEVARAVGIGAVKYADLSQNPQSLVVFSWDKALSMTGNSAPYLQYACARIASVLEKYGERFPGRNPAEWPLQLAAPIERALALKLARFPETVIGAAESYKPSVLADYLFGVAQDYSAFYQNVPFLKADEGVRESRVRLCAAVAKVLRQGLALLGIATPQRI
jgi:arginyl-tRNA synthetase